MLDAGSSAIGPEAQYRALLAGNVLEADPAQAHVVDVLETRFHKLCRPPPRWRKWLNRPGPVVRGLYLHGGVGRGKTLLMDMFAAALDLGLVPVRRVHFHRFMDEIHRALRNLDGARDPLRQVAGNIASRARVMCFDEFHVSDIGDAMILAELLSAMFDRGVMLVATSNTAPRELYAGGLQRARFRPAIDLIERHCEVLELDSGQDYRLRELTRHPLYYTPNENGGERELVAEFDALARGETVSKTPIRIRARDIQPVRRAGAVAWFEFDVLCGGPRSSSDYIELARRFGTLIVSEVPAMDDDHNDPARRFIHLVDECYDRGVKLIISAAVPPEVLYRGRRLADPFQRTASRLIEMQSREYLERPHRP